MNPANTPIRAKTGALSPRNASYDPSSAPPATLDVSVVIVNWNARDLLRDCLKSIAEQTRCRHEVIVVDNASKDESAEMVRREFPGVVLVANTDNKGFAAANNQGMRIARGRTVLLLNPDTIVLDGAIDRALEFLDARPKVGCVGVQVWEDERTIQRTCFAFPSAVGVLWGVTALDTRFPRSRVFASHWLGTWDRLTERAVDVVSGMFMLVRREVLADVGLMDEDYFVYAEEADWCHRMAERGWSRVFTPVGRIIHREGGGQSTRLASTRMYVQLQKSTLIFMRKRRGAVEHLLARAVYFAASLARWLANAAKSLAARGPRGERARAKAAQSRASMRYLLTGRSPA